MRRLLPRRGGSTLWLRALLAAGALLAVALLVQTISNYQYVSNSLILQDGRRVAEERVRNVERAVRLARPADAAAFQVLLDDVRSETAEQVAGLSLVQSSGAMLASSGLTAPAAAVDRERRGTAERAPMTRDSRDGRDILVGVFPCRCSAPSRPGQTPDTSSARLPAPTAPQASTQPASQPAAAGPLRVQVLLYEDSLSAPFSRLRRNAIISASAALTLLVALGLIALRAGAYVRGKQLEAEVALARQVQRDLLPSAGTQPPGLDVAAECLPTSQVGGDFYDTITHAGGRASFVLGDVSGHGIAAALLMGLIHGAMSNPPWGASEEPDLAAVRLNDLLLTKSSGERFASLFWCSYDPASRILRYLNAGHLPALWLRRDAAGVWHVERLADGGPVLGLLPAAVYRTASVSANPGDLLVIFSDGITEAPNRRDEPFGEERLIEATQQSRDLPARAVCDAILGRVRAFTGDRPSPDDQTLLVVRLWADAPRVHA